ncbi:MAG: hypothetical protein ACRC5M_00215, partial [Anaeroplasmataceae bacterium]
MENKISSNVVISYIRFVMEILKEKASPLSDKKRNELRSKLQCLHALYKESDNYDENFVFTGYTTIGLKISEITDMLNKNGCVELDFIINAIKTIRTTMLTNKNANMKKETIDKNMTRLATLKNKRNSHKLYFNGYIPVNTTHNN